MSTAAPQAINEAKLHEFMMKAVGETGAAINTALKLVGDKRGLYKPMARGAGCRRIRNFRFGVLALHPAAAAGNGASP